MYVLIVQLVNWNHLVYKTSTFQCQAKESNHQQYFKLSGQLKFFQKNPGDHRRKWDKDEYERLAQERLEEEERKQLEKELREPHQKRELLKPREYKARVLLA